MYLVGLLAEMNLLQCITLVSSKFSTIHFAIKRHCDTPTTSTQYARLAVELYNRYVLKLASLDSKLFTATYNSVVKHTFVKRMRLTSGLILEIHSFLWNL